MKKVYLRDIAKAPFIDRFFYYLLNYFSLSFDGKSYMTWNPLKWSIMTLILSLWAATFYLVVFPILGIPAIAMDAKVMPRYHGDDCDIFVNDVRLLRKL